MATYSDQQTFSFDDTPPSRRITFSIADGSSVVIEASVNGGWIVTDTVTASTAAVVFTQNTRIRITPTGVVSYEVDEEGRLN